MASGNSGDNFNLDVTVDGTGSAPDSTGDSASGIDVAIDPAIARSGGNSDSTGNATAGSEPGKRRGRPRGSKNRATAASDQDLGAITSVLLSTHQLLAVVSKCEELELDETDAKLLADGIIRVEKHYPKVSAVFSGKVADHLVFFSAVARVYGTRLAAIAVRKRNEAAAQDNVVEGQFRRGPVAS